MTQEIFLDWLTKRDRQLKRNVLLLLDNCTAHAIDLNLKHINIVFLPVNMTSLTQPYDQGIIHTLKSFYRTEMRRNLISVMDKGLDGTSILCVSEIAKKISCLEALHFIKKAWDEVSDVTIRNCFHHRGFIRVKQEDNPYVIEKPADLSDEDYEAWINVDVNLETAEKTTEERICRALMNQSDDTIELEDNDDKEEPEKNHHQPKKLCKPFTLKEDQSNTVLNLSMTFFYMNGLSNECLIEEENRKQEEKIRREETRRRIEREHELELARIRATRNDENRSPPPSVTSNGDGDISVDKLIKGVEILTIPVPRKTESWNLFFDSLERAYKHKKVPEEFQAEILLKLLGDKASNVLVYIKEEDLKDYAKVKVLILEEFEPTPQACLENFRKAKRNSGETHIQFVSRLTSTWEYYCKLCKVEDYESLKELIISDKLFQVLDNDTASHICLKQGEKWLRPQELAKECDIYFGAKQKSFDESWNDLKRTFSSQKYVPSRQRRSSEKFQEGITAF
ncbi:hypothetical protein AVEN_115149-1 [Araneus ventricosus]|uniref:DDE-1 domain-containing protein n=1 Tax=Araneus ventricosus TaxID=182803 RepID=A0A4Y1ZXF4_ARAVE|nr:hypothetical protein AVEN_115149-1 [Araneus ventricosus]